MIPAGLQGFRSKSRYANPKQFPKFRTAAGWLCRYCRSAIPKGRRTSFCNKECEFEWDIRTNSGAVRRAVGKRDKGICAECKFDSKKLARIFKWANKLGGNTKSLSLNAKQMGFSRGWYSYSAFWEAHHTKPVAEGGGSAPLDEIITLCSPCHQAAHKLARKRRAG